MKRMLSLLTALIIMATLLLTGCGKAEQTGSETKTSGEKKKYKIATVVKIDGIAWYDRMEKGIEKFAADNGVDAYMVGPQKADAALQVQLVEDLIAQKVDAICIVPFSPEALEPVLQKARDKGIVVITHEASNIKNADFDIEAFNNADYGAHFMENLGKLMGGEGEYATFVGSLTSKSHMEWVDAAVKLQKEKFPNMKLVAEKIETNDDQQTAYNKAKELLKTYPNLKGIQTSDMPGNPGVALAIEEAGLSDKVSLVGTSLVSVSGKYITSGAADMIGFWDPADAGYAMSKLALMILEGKKGDIKTGLDLGIKGYNNLQVNGTVINGQAWIDVNKDNMNDYNF